jgi:predicted AlkP superfamily pyrophosphatase or phosphodiesterase
MRAVVAFLLLLTFWFSSSAPALSASRPDLLILVSIDGFRADYLTHHRTPVIDALARQGVSAAMRPSFPSETAPNHYTLVTGLRPDHHGITANTIEDPALGRFTMQKSDDPRWWEEGQPLWVTADEQGLKTASMFWVGSDREIRGHRPDYWKLYDQSVPGDDRVDQVLKWLDLPEDRRPSFVTLYFDIVDTEGHRHGPNSKELDAALASTDASLGRLMEGLKARGLYDRANLIVTADHGMADTSKDRLVYIDDLAGGADRIHAVSLGATAGLSIAPGAPRDTLARLVARHDHLQCWPKAKVPPALHYGRNPRVPPVVCAAEVGWYITTHERIASIKDFNLGSHGYDPASPAMAALFVAEGPAFRKGVRLAPFDNVDVEPLMVELLGLKGSKVDGMAATFTPGLTRH